MAISKDVSIVINSVDLSASLRAITFEEGVDQEPAEAHGDTYRFFEAGMQNSSPLVCDFWQDYTTGGVDETLRALLSDTNGFTVVIKPTSGAVSATNPSFTATCNLERYLRESGEVGSRKIATAAFVLAASTGVGGRYFVTSG